MVQGNEILNLLLGFGTLLFILLNLPRLAKIKSSRLLLGAYFVLFAASILTVLEGLFWSHLLNFLEHLCYLLSQIMVTLWCWKIYRSKDEIL